MKTKLLSKSTLLSLLVIVLLLAGCGANTGTGNGTSNGSEGTAEKDGNAGAGGSAQGGKIKLSYWTMDRHDMDYMQQLVDKYNQTNKDNIEVEMKVLADNFNQALEVAFASNQAPDIFRVFDFQTYVNKGYLAQLDGLLSEDFKAKFKGLLVENVYTVDGHIYSLPNTGQFWRLIYNVDLLEKAGYKEPPKTLQEMVEVAKKITEVGKAEGAYGFASNFKNGSGFTRPAYASSTLGTGMGHEGFNYNTGEFDFNMYRDIAEALHQIKKDGSMLPGSESLDIDPLRAQFAQGKIGMYINHSSEPAVYQSQFPTTIRWASALVPTKDGQQNGVTWVNASGYLGISAKSEHQEAAAKFMEYIYSPEIRKEYQEKGLGISVLPYVNEIAGKPNLAGIEGFLPTKYDGIYPATPLSITETKLEGPKMTDAFIKYILTDDGDLDAVIADLNTRYAKALKQARDEGLTKIGADPSFSAKALQGTLSK